MLIFLGKGTFCLPLLSPAFLLLFAAAFSPLDKDFHALSGKYLFLPSDLDPSGVRHFCLLHLDKEFLEDLLPL